MDRTFIIIKPDAVRNQHTGNIINRIEKEGFRILALRLIRLSQKQAKDFYAVHKDRSFYQDLISFMISGPVVVAVLESENAVNKWRELIGATDPTEAKENTIRKLYAESKEANAVHGSDSNENAKQEIAFFFQETDLCSYA